MDRVTIVTPEKIEVGREQTLPANLLTVSGGLLLLVLLLAAAIRLTGLAGLPLSPAEAETALAVWRFWQPGLTPADSSFSPAYFSLTGPLTQLLGEGDAVMRLVPALMGLLLVALPWLWRRTLGTLGALVGSLLLALSPTASILANTVGGDSLALAAVLLLAISWSRYRQGDGTVWLYTAAATLALGLTSSPLFYSGLLGLSLAWLAWRFFGGSLWQSPSEDGSGPSRQTMRRAGLIGGVVFLALATMALTHPAGLGAVAAQAELWLGSFFRGGNTLASWLAALLALVRYELILIIPGFFAILWAAWRGQPFPLFLSFWFAAGLLVALLQPGIPANVALIVLPGVLLIGCLAQELFSEPAGRGAWVVFLAVSLAGAIAYFNLARYLRLVLSLSAEYNRLLESLALRPEDSFLFMAFIALGLALIIANFVRSWDPPAAAQGALAGVLLLMLVYQWGTAWWLTHAGANDPRELWTITGTDTDVELLVEILAEVSRQSVGIGDELSLLVAIEHPVLHWYLRDYDNAVWGETVPPGADQQAILTAATETGLALDNRYFGSDFGLLQRSTADVSGTPLSPLDTLRWWLFHESPAPREQEQVILWVRNDITR